MDYLLGILLEYSIYKGYVDKLFRDKRVQKYLVPGNLILTMYDAKYEAPYDARPLFLVLHLETIGFSC